MKRDDKRIRRAIKKFYSFENYKPNKNAVPVTYKGTEYLSKAQCMALEGITRKELDAYLKGEVNDPAPIPEPEAVPVPEEIMAVEDAVPERVNPINNLGVFDDDVF